MFSKIAFYIHKENKKTWWLRGISLSQSIPLLTNYTTPVFPLTLSAITSFSEGLTKVPFNPWNQLEIHISVWCVIFLSCSDMATLRLTEIREKDGGGRNLINSQHTIIESNKITLIRFLKFSATKWEEVELNCPNNVGP